MIELHDSQSRETENVTMDPEPRMTVMAKDSSNLPDGRTDIGRPVIEVSSI
jgi:hypothetical protein